jgi:tight adherence protein B
MYSLLIFLFLCLLAIVLAASALGFRYLEAQRRKQVRQLLRSVEGNGGNGEHDVLPAILMDPQDGSPLSRDLGHAFSWLNIPEKMHQAGVSWTLPGFAVASLLGAVAGGLLGWKFEFLVFPSVSILVLAAAGGCLPYIVLMWKRRQRFAAFEEQFPEALDFLARSMRAGHAFSVSLEMIGAESPDPLGAEFRTLFNEQNLGAPLETAFGNLLRRLPLGDVRFFVSSVLLQRQTGGNLSEILVRLAYVIRERFRLRGQVKAASAHGRLTAGVLVLMPILLVVGLMIVAPGYLQEMAKDPDGKWLILSSLVAQAVGFFFIRRIINIKV